MEKTRTFAEVVANGGHTKVTGAKKGTKKKEVKEVCWNGAYEDNTWLSKCAIGVLKRFDKVTKVNRRLANRGIIFNSMYLRDKSIVWSFESEKDCTSFITENFLWEDSFSAMEKGSCKVVATSRIAWINLMGVPLCHWNSEFFFEIGKQVGEPLLIDDDTLFKRRFF